MIKISEQQEQVLQDALKTFGDDAQIWMAIEEMAELNNALAKKVRGRTGWRDVAEEVADVFIMMQQLAIMAYSPWVQATINEKIERLSKRIKENNINLGKGE